jgi:hypothetical protein
MKRAGTPFAERKLEYKSHQLIETFFSGYCQHRFNITLGDMAAGTIAEPNPNLPSGQRMTCQRA